MTYFLFAIAILIFTVLLLIFIAMLRPSAFQISRSIDVNAIPEKLFPYINNLHQFQEWSPFREKDPQASQQFSGPESGPGATLHWSGNSNVGEGIMKIVDHSLHVKVIVDLEFLKPFAGHNTVEFSLDPKEDNTRVTWSMTGNYALVPKIIGLFINMDRMIGNDFDKGLARLKSLVE